MNEFAEYNYLCHYGILGMKWGVRRYQNPDGSLTAAGRTHYGVGDSKNYKGGHEKDADFTLKKGTKLQTLSGNKDRTKNTDYFFASHTKGDSRYYRGNYSIDTKTRIAGIVPTMKYKITNVANSDIKVASENTGRKVMNDLYNKDEDFRNFVNDPERLASISNGSNVRAKKAYDDAFHVLESINKKGSATPEELDAVYKLFNYELPNDGRGDEAVAADIARQREKFFKSLKKAGYSAVLDTNDTYYGNFKGNVESAVIVFDNDKIIPEDVRRMKLDEAIISRGMNMIEESFRTATGKYH